jgi:hypothetical protein
MKSQETVTHYKILDGKTIKITIMKTTKYLFGVILVCFSILHLASCSDADVNRAWGSKTAPVQVSNVRVKNISGGAILYFDRPDDVNFYYLKAIYNSEPGVEMSANSSYYTDSILLVGFATAGEYDVNLYSMSYGDAASKPVVVKIQPTTPPYLLVAENLEITPTFGGVRVQSVNETGANLSIEVVKKNSESKWEDVTTAYTKAQNINFAARGLDPEPAEFGVLIKDRWGHKSPIVSQALTPWYEVECDKSIMKKYVMSNGSEFASDTWQCHQWASTQPPNPENKLERLWDGMKNTSTQPTFHTKLDAPMPQHFTADLGDTYKLSRLVIHWRAIPSATAYFFDSGHIRYFELWGSNDPNIKDNFEDPWFKIGDFESKRPSGSTRPSTIDPLTEDEKEIITYGQEFEIPEDTPPVRYYRFKSLETWGKIQAVMVNELTFYGTDSK